MKIFTSLGGGDKKPFNYARVQKEALKKYGYKLVEPEKMIMVGDRLATDMIFGNLNGMATIHVKPFATKWPG